MAESDSDHADHAADTNRPVPEVDHVLSGDITMETGGFDLSTLDERGAVLDAIETVRDDHSERVLVDEDNLYALRVRWNNNTDAARIDALTHSETWEVSDSAQGDLSRFAGGDA